MDEHGKPVSGRYREAEFQWAMSHVVLCLVGLKVSGLGIFGLGKSGLGVFGH